MSIPSDRDIFLYQNHYRFVSRPEVINAVVKFAHVVDGDIRRQLIHTELNTLDRNASMRLFNIERAAGKI